MTWSKVIVELIFYESYALKWFDLPQAVVSMLLELYNDSCIRKSFNQEVRISTRKRFPVFLTEGRAKVPE